MPPSKHRYQVHAQNISYSKIKQRCEKSIHTLDLFPYLRKQPFVQQYLMCIITVANFHNKNFLILLHQFSGFSFSKIQIICCLFHIYLSPVLKTLNNISSLLNNRIPAAHYRTYTFPLLSGPNPPG